MNTSKLESFAQAARLKLRKQVAARLEQVLSADNVEARERADALEELRQEISQKSKQAVIDQVAYTWFNRFSALRFMDVNRYTRVGIVSSLEGYIQPELLHEAKQGVVLDDLQGVEDDVQALLNGKVASSNPQQEAYRKLLVGACNYYHAQMPFLFQKIKDYTELLMPEDLLSENSILYDLRAALTPEICQDVEVIGWLYQFYISEKKDEVIGSKSKIQAEEIPAATQLFTPHWIVCYLVENSLGRLWMLNNPTSKLVEQMDYYIQPEEQEHDFLRIESPEEIKVCDPACGSGHMLTYAFDLLYAIYAEQGYDPVRIPALILKNNLYGIEIDERAGDLAGFALMMKARERDRRFFNRGVEPNICVLENISFNADELKRYKEAVGNDLFTQGLWELLKQFEQVENVGSLIQTAVKNPEQVRERLEELGVFGEMFLHNTNEKVKQALTQAEYLGDRYHVVVANPPYMGSRNMNTELKQFGKDYYPDSKKDLFAMFMERGLELTQSKAYLAMITMQSWMFLSSFEKIRNKLINYQAFLSMAHLAANAFDTISGEVVSTTAFVLKNYPNLELKGAFVRLVDGNSETEKNENLKQAVQNPDCGWFYQMATADFKKIPGAPIAYWVSDRLREVFDEGQALETIANPRQGMATGDNAKFLRYWQEIQYNKIGLRYSSIQSAHNSNKKYFPYNKGGSYRKWYGNNDFVIRFDQGTYRILKQQGNHCPSEKYYFKPGITWSFVSSSYFGVRYSDPGFIFDVGGSSVFPDSEDIFWLTGYMCSKLSTLFMKAVNPTLNFQVGNVASLPIIQPDKEKVKETAKQLIKMAREDWDSYERSWGFKELPLLRKDFHRGTLASTYAALRKYWNNTILEMKFLEEENNSIFIEAYGLEDELDPVAPLEEITLTYNPHYRYRGDKSEEELEALLLEDTMKELISYSVGCMFGRYSLDKPGLILANQGDTLETYLAQIPEPTFLPDDDNVIPLLDEGWFEDDITERFKHFLRVTFGDEHYQENLDFLEKAIGRDIRSFFLKEFYEYHCKMYSKPTTANGRSIGCSPARRGASKP